ncbi:MAG: choice-of-anchor B family protein [Lewinellaceae bacterium]|nr:choice-of-anchor B family protein [Lewinellaceae bacterium]
MKKLLFTLLTALALCGTAIAQDFNVQLRSTMNFPGETLANICGYWQGGREYALVGASKGMVVVDITNPDVPVKVVQIPGPDNLWKEIKVYSHYAYVTSEGGGGLQIIDLSNLPGANLAYHSYTGEASLGNLNTIHALHIDVTKGFVYLYGSNLFSGGAVVLDLNADPYNPTYAGKFDQLGYIHDGYVDNDTLYGGHIYTGTLSVVNMANKQNPVLLGTVQTPGKFTHNAWLLDDHKHILTTDETTPSFLAAFDVTDPTDIKELDRFSPNDGYGSYVHNTHVLNDWAVTSWYTDGFTIVDAHRPDNLVMTASYDTYAGSGAQFDGCWGVFPYFPSGTIIGSNIEPGDLFIFTPNYVRACYLEGSITDGCNNAPLSGVSIEVNSGAPQVNTSSKSNGVFKTGQSVPGDFVVTISKAGYITQTINVSLQPGEVTTLDITLEPISAVNISGQVLDALTGLPIPNAPIVLSGPNAAYNLNTNSQGNFSINCAFGGDYQVYAGAWGYLPSDAFTVTGSDPVTVSLDRGYYDDFALNYTWTTSSTAPTGAWVRDIPIGTTQQGQLVNPGSDVDFDGNELCYVTGNGGGNAGTDDVDNGVVTLTSPKMELAAFNDGILSFWYWFVNTSGSGTPNDTLTVFASNGQQTVKVFSQTVSASQWRYSGDISLKDFLPLTNNMTVRFVTGDLPASGHLVEAGVDAFKVIPTGSASGTQTAVLTDANLKISPNPSAADFRLRYEWPSNETISLEVMNTLGQLVYTQQLNGKAGNANIPNLQQKGLYYVRLRGQSGISQPVTIVQQ